ncbi:MAG: cytochrome c oxidase cbb3-type subunit 4 [Marivirga sp.]|jgi:cytochrome c oxidase cbb3-type subunit 4
MFKHYFEVLDNVQIYPLISLSIFFAFFIGLIWWVIRADKQYISEMEQLPFSEDEVKTKKPKS